jgi:hypothetical protein
MRFKELLLQIQEHFGLEELRLEKGRLQLNLADDVVATLHERPHKDPLLHRFYLSSIVAVAPPEGRDLRAVLTICLEANFYGQGTNGAVFAFDRLTREVVFFRGFDPRRLTFKIFLRTLDDLVLHVREWRRRFESKDYYGSWRKNYKMNETKTVGGLPQIDSTWMKI